MVTMLLACLAGGFGGGVIAVLLSWRARRSASDSPPLDSALEQHIDGAATQWAAVHGRPAAAPLIAGKLRLAYDLSQRPRRRRWWSR